MLCEGVRRTEVTQIRLTDLPADLVTQPLIRVVPLKGARAEEEGRRTKDFGTRLSFAETAS
jgi:hypothetical protein